MRFLLDENISPRLAPLLVAAGHDALHVREMSLARAPDSVIMDFAGREGRVIVSADADFGDMLAHTNASRPSVVFLRRQQGRRATLIAALLIANLDAVVDDLLAGAIVVIDDHRVRVRRLPLSGTADIQNE